MSLTIRDLAEYGVADKSEKEVSKAVSDMESGGFKRIMANAKTGSNQETTEAINAYKGYLEASGKTHEQAMDGLDADSNDPKYANMAIDDYFKNKTEGLGQSAQPSVADTPDTNTLGTAAETGFRVESSTPPIVDTDGGLANNKLLDILSQFAQDGADGISNGGGNIGSMLQNVCAKFGIELPPKMVDFCNELGDKHTPGIEQSTLGREGQNLTAEETQPDLDMDTPTLTMG